MADFGHSSDDATEKSQEGSSQDSKVDFSEDEETLIERMFNLLGEVVSDCRQNPLKDSRRN